LLFAQDGFKLPVQISVVKTIQSILSDFLNGVSPAIISGRFHRTIAEIVLEVCQMIRKETGIQSIALSGGVWQNITLLEQAFELLKEAGFQVLTHRDVPANDGGISVGQVAIAAKVFGH
jgi:hydrogenase maturation protein HypF